MQTLSRKDIPADFTYYRSGSRTFLEYHGHRRDVQILQIGEGDQFCTITSRLGGLYHTVLYEKIDIEPSRAMLKRAGLKRGVILWCPLRRIERPTGWVQLPRIFTRSAIHSPRSAFCVLDQDDHTTNWSPRARGSLHKAKEYIQNGDMKIEQIDDLETFLQYYQSTTIHDPHKSSIENMLEMMVAAQVPGLRIYLVKIHDEVMGGALFIDTGVTSEYFVSFFDERARAYQAGIAVMDRWMTDSQSLGIKYCDLDHMYSAGDGISKKGYTKFKESIADYDVYFRDLWIRFF